MNERTSFLRGELDGTNKPRHLTHSGYVLYSLSVVYGWHQDIPTFLVSIKVVSILNAEMMAIQNA